MGRGLINSFSKDFQKVAEFVILEFQSLKMTNLKYGNSQKIILNVGFKGFMGIQVSFRNSNVIINVNISRAEIQNLQNPSKIGLEFDCLFWFAASFILFLTSDSICIYTAVLKIKAGCPFVESLSIIA